MHGRLRSLSGKKLAIAWRVGNDSEDSTAAWTGMATKKEMTTSSSPAAARGMATATVGVLRARGGGDDDDDDI